jgi:hypothetical protein
VQNQAIHGHLNRIEQDEEHGYGFICKLNHQEGSGSPHSLTHYEEGESGNKVAFVPDDVGSFPSVGDIVMFSRSGENGSMSPSNIELL